jgi:hypothetical protein
MAPADRSRADWQSSGRLTGAPVAVSIPLNAVMFGGIEAQCTTRQLNRFAMRE